MVPATTGCVTAGVISLWPPATTTFNRRQAAPIWAKIAVARSVSVAPAGKSSVGR